MRTTVTLEDDLAGRLRDEAHERGVPFKTAINDAIRDGLDHRAELRRYRVKARPMGPARVDVTKALQIAERMENEEAVREFHLGR